MTPEEQDEHRRADRTRTLVIAVACGISEWKKGTAREIVPKYAEELELLGQEKANVPGLARAMDVDRANLHVCLGGDPKNRRDNVRRRLEDFLGLTPGGMTQALSLMEKLP